MNRKKEPFVHFLCYDKGNVNTQVDYGGMRGINVDPNNRVLCCLINDAGTPVMRYLRVENSKVEFMEEIKHLQELIDM